MVLGEISLVIILIKEIDVLLAGSKGRLDHVLQQKEVVRVVTKHIPPKFPRSLGLGASAQAGYRRVRPFLSKLHAQRPCRPAVQPTQGVKHFLDVLLGKLPQLVSPRILGAPNGLDDDLWRSFDVLLTQVPSSIAVNAAKAHQYPGQEFLQERFPPAPRPLRINADEALKERGEIPLAGPLLAKLPGPVRVNHAEAHQHLTHRFFPDPVPKLPCQLRVQAAEGKGNLGWSGLEELRPERRDLRQLRKEVKAAGDINRLAALQPVTELHRLEGNKALKAMRHQGRLTVHDFVAKGVGLARADPGDEEGHVARIWARQPLKLFNKNAAYRLLPLRLPWDLKGLPHPLHQDHGTPHRRRCIRGQVQRCQFAVAFRLQKADHSLVNTLERLRNRRVSVVNHQPAIGILLGQLEEPLAHFFPKANPHEAFSAKVSQT